MWQEGAEKTKKKSHVLLKFTGFEIYGCALGILALQTFHPGQTALPFSKANVRPGIESILRKPQVV